MLQYSPDQLQWMLLVSANTLALVLFILGAIALIWALYALFAPVRPTAAAAPAAKGEEVVKRKRPKKGFRQSFQELPEDSLDRSGSRRGYLPIWIGIPGALAIAAALLLPHLASEDDLAEGVSGQLSSTAEFQDVKLLHIETVSSSPLTKGSVSFIGTALDVDGDPRQFRYTQYQNFGIYEMVGFDKPAVNLKDNSFESLERGLDILQGGSADMELEPEGTDVAETPAPSESPAPSETPAG